MIIPDTLPNPLYFRCEPLWLAYCSYSYFSANTSGQARQIWMAGGYPPARCLTTSWCQSHMELASEGQTLPFTRGLLPPVDSSELAPLPLVVYNVTQRRNWKALTCRRRLISSVLVR